MKRTSIIRAAIRGLIDGSLSTLGVVIGASSAQEVTVIISAGFSGAIANGFSNILAAFSAERAQGYIEMRKTERAMISGLKGTKIEETMRKEVTKMGVIDGVFTVLGGLIPIFPFLFIDPFSSVILAIATVALLAAGIGAYTGTFSRENMALTAIKMGLFALLTAVICIGVERMF